MTFKINKSVEFTENVIVHEPNGNIKRRSKFKVVFEMIDFHEYEELLDEGGSELLERVIKSVDGVELSQELIDDGYTPKSAVIASIPARNQMIRTYSKAMDGGDGKNSKRLR